MLPNYADDKRSKSKVGRDNFARLTYSLAEFTRGATNRGEIWPLIYYQEVDAVFRAIWLWFINL